MNEGDLYEPVGDALVENLRRYTTGVSVHNTSQGLNHAVKKNLDNIALAYRRRSQYRPDLVVGAWTDTEAPEYFQIVVEVKRGRPTLEAISEAWLYQQLLDTKLALVVGTEHMEEEVARAFHTRDFCITQPGRRLDVATYNPAHGSFKRWVRKSPKQRIWELSNNKYRKE